MSERTGISWTDHKPVQGFPGYAISSDGAVVGPRGWKLRPGGTQRPIVVLYRDGRPHAMQVSRLVLTAFAGPPPADDACALHENDDSWDNRIRNLRWGSRSENKADERRNRGNVSGRQRKLANIPDVELFDGSAREAARRLGTTHSVVICERSRRHG